MLWERRLISAGAYLAGFAPFVSALLSALKMLADEAARRVGQTEYRR